jgi:hypothetical protein
LGFSTVTSSKGWTIHDWPLAFLAARSDEPVTARATRWGAVRMSRNATSQFGPGRNNMKRGALPTDNARLCVLSGGRIGKRL